jgi:hypothetical protein
VILAKIAGAMQDSTSCSMHSHQVLLAQTDRRTRQKCISLVPDTTCHVGQQRGTDSPTALLQQIANMYLDTTSPDEDTIPPDAQLACTLWSLAGGYTSRIGYSNRTLGSIYSHLVIGMRVHELDTVFTGCPVFWDTSLLGNTRGMPKTRVQF